MASETPPTLDTSCPDEAVEPLESEEPETTSTTEIVTASSSTAISSASSPESSDTEAKKEEGSQTSTEGSNNENALHSDEPKNNYISESKSLHPSKFNELIKLFNLNPVSLNPEITEEELNEYERQLKKKGGSIRYKYDSFLLKGFSVSIRDGAIQTLSEDPRIQFIGIDLRLPQESEPLDNAPSIGNGKVNQKAVWTVLQWQSKSALGKKSGLSEGTKAYFEELKGFTG
ncbi:uncharacterized protein MELLADRAFT_67100 [Melampsora larici-populina 98AG31]|uniref:Uncharacterized protein n=1 Tax=Melampsora larici-populina (strain 98AG31 / pathotype 3-4-7) TaxID=747676 RepID=F4S1S8_MELLP|nr:uncharacterized protein MELLADRAFT_67100 [Melampsora larici-populina 98AG31]EGG01428.1 hypothetical protein MELLADRAFT_67100 [Melampsora larici-populina 98AG31]